MGATHIALGRAMDKQLNNPDAIAYGYDEEGFKKLVPIIGIGCRSRLEWRNGSGQQCEAPSAIRNEWRSLSAWILENQDG
jgi:hypothetical protein